jgi:multidrug efflux pump subunit AcrB
MSLASFAVKRYQFTLVLFALLIALGFYAFRSMPRAADPSFPIPVVSIIAVYPGTDPKDMEALVTDPIEDAIAELDDVKAVFSRVQDGLSITRVEFSWDVEAEKKYDEAIREMNALRPSLPSGLAEFVIQKANPNNVKIVQFALISDGPDALPTHELRKYAERLETALETAPGIKKAEYWGLPQSEVQITLDPKRVKAARLSLARVIDAVRADAQNIPGGAISVSDRRFNLKTSGDYADIDAVANTVVGTASGQVIRLKDVASIALSESERSEQARFNGRRAVFVAANQKAAQNIFNVRKAVAQRVSAFEKTLPKNVELVWGFDQSVNVAQRLNTLGRDFMIAIALVLLTLLPLGLRAAGVVMVSIPLSLAVGLACMYFTGFSLNQLSIAGFVIALGLLVDDSIVVVENIERHLREGKSPRQAAIEATDQISLAVLGCTATLILAFLPLMFLPEGAGKFVRNIPASVLATVTASLFVSLTIVPFLASRVLRTHAHSQGNALLRWLTNGIHRVYTPLMKIALARPKATLLATAVLFFATLGLVPKIGFSLFPLADSPQFLISIETPDGSSVKETDRVLKRVEAILAETPEIKHQFANLGRGNKQIFYNVFPRELEANYAEIYAELTRYQAEATPLLFDKLRARFADIAGARIIIKPFENGPPIDAPIAIRLSGPDLEQLGALAKQVTSLIEQTEGTRDVLNPIKLHRTDLALNVDAQKAGLVGVASAEIDRTVRLAVAGLTVANYRDDEGDEYPIVLRLPLTQGTPSMDLLEQMEVNSQSGDSILLKQFINPSFDSSPTQIQRYQRARSVMLTAYTRTGFNTGEVTNQILEKLEALKMPRGYRWQAAGEVESREDSFSGIGAAILVAVFGIMAVLILEFGSFKSMLVVAGVIPLGIVGGLLALLLSGYSLSFTASIGFIALIGIEIKNSILLVDFTNQLRAQGTPLLEAIERAGEVRFLPILLTSLTAIGGLLPLALAQAALYSPMAWVMIGGLISSTLLARLVTPVMYLLLPPPIEAQGEF